MTAAPRTEGPARTCVGCRQRGPAAAMARLALAGGRLVVWPVSGQVPPRPPGRGASVHATEACLQRAVKSGAFARAFRQRVEVDGAALLQQLLRAPAS